MSPGLRVLAVAAVCAVIGASSGRAQSVDLSGTWTLDIQLSDNPEQVAASIRADLGENEFDLFSEAESARGGRGGRRERQSGDSSRATPKPGSEAQKTLDAITQSVRYPPTSLRLTETPDVVTAAEGELSRTFHVNGKKEPQTYGGTQVTSTARWEGPQLVVDVDIGSDRTMTYTYSIVPATHQLLVRVTLRRAPNRSGPFEIRFVYDRT